MNLPYIGLQGSAGPACQPKETKSKRDILNEYRRAGYGPKELAMVKSELMTAKSIKKSKHGYFINGILFSLVNKPKGLNFGGYGGSGDFGGGSGAGASQGTGVPGNGGIPTDGQGGDITWEDIKELIKFVTDTISWLKEQVDWVKSIISDCSTSVWPPEKAEEDVKEALENFQIIFNDVKNYLNTGNIRQAVKRINDASRYAYGYRWATIKAAQEGKFHKCSEKSGLEIFKPARDKFIALVNKFGKKYFAKAGYNLLEDHMQKEEGYSWKVFKAIKQTGTGTGAGTGTGTGTGTAPAGQKKSALPLLGLLTAGYLAFK